GPGVSDELDDRIAGQVGGAVARRGAVLVCGGMTGVMEAACRAAKREGGTTIGILPGSERTDANPYVDIAIATGMGEMRNALIVRTADVLVAVGGAFGTLSEIALALKTGVPVVGIGTWELARPGSGGPDPIVRAADAEEAVALALERARRVS
ncbi:MAG: TIGR00725 family protein, partial [Actinobacteria bacterium]|nr:TIGR00725 family protein [Actinomycetota bacterium]